MPQAAAAVPAQYVLPIVSLDQLAYSALPLACTSAGTTPTVPPPGSSHAGVYPEPLKFFNQRATALASSYTSPCHDVWFNQPQDELYPSLLS